MIKIKPACMLLALGLIINAAHAESRYYRYKDIEGNLIISSTIDSESSRLGYEIIDASGKVVRKVEAEATSEERQEVIKKRQQESEQREFDLSLVRKYSFVTDIEAEKKRKLAELQANVAIVKGNLGGVRAELDALYANAAAIEREGKPVNEGLKNKIKNVEAVVISTEELYKLRQADIIRASAEYDKAIKRFQEIQALRGKK